MFRYFNMLYFFQTPMAIVYLLMEETKKSSIAKINLIQVVLLFCSTVIHEIEEYMCLCFGGIRGKTQEHFLRSHPPCFVFETECLPHLGNSQMASLGGY